MLQLLYTYVASVFHLFQTYVALVLHVATLAGAESGRMRRRSPRRSGPHVHNKRSGRGWSPPARASASTSGHQHALGAQRMRKCISMRGGCASPTVACEDGCAYVVVVCGD
jgi:hypothetical protein